MSARPTHRQLEYLVAVSETGHFREAASRCNVSQPTLSTQIQLLEDRLRAKLIERAPGGARPTPLGEIVIDLARTVLATLDEIQNVAINAEANLGGLVRLGVVPTFGPYFLPRVLPRLRAQYPELELYIREERPLELEQSLASGTLDCALTRPPERGPRLTYHELTEERLQLGIPSDHALANEARILPEMLQGQRMLTLGPDYSLNRYVRELCQVSGAVMSEDYEGTSLDAIRQMVSIGMGFSLFPERYVASEFPKETSVVLRDIEGMSLVRAIGLVWRDGSVRSSQYLRLLEECKQALSDG
ncbi:MAG: hydrogen peroxide-inducible genes activator [Pseudomonadota bacterium]